MNRTDKYEVIDTEGVNLQSAEMNTNLFTNNRAIAIVATVFILSTLFVQHNSKVIDHSHTRAIANPFASINCTEIGSLPMCQKSNSLTICGMCTKNEGLNIALSNPFGNIDCAEISALPMCKNNPNFMVCSNCNETVEIARANINPFASINCTEIEALPICEKSPSLGICSKCSISDK